VRARLGFVTHARLAFSQLHRAALGRSGDFAIAKFDSLVICLAHASGLLQRQCHSLAATAHTALS
jgi:hypothetical protein